MTSKAILENFYSRLTLGDFTNLIQDFPDNMSFNVAGKSALAGKYSKDTFLTSYLTKLREFSGGKIKLEVHDVLSSDRHAAVLLTYTIDKNDKPTQMRVVHVWRMENEKLAAGYEYPRDMYQYDSIWS